MGWFDKLKEGLLKTSKGITEKVEEIISFNTKIDDDLYEELEEVLIMADMGFETTEKVMEMLKEKVKKSKATESSEVTSLLKEIISDILGEETKSVIPEKTPAIYLVVGVNGVGKTTSIGKMANYLKEKGLKVGLAAGDTFRAAAIDQLQVWGQRCNVDVIKHQEGSDPAAVIFDAVKSAKAKNLDVLICDTAGRLHNKKNLMEELRKINKIIEREYPEALKETFLVLDSTTGQNALIQAKQFMEVSDVSGLILTKLDGTAKGGVVVAIASELNVPVKMIGVGEGIDDLQEFNPKAFSEALFQ
ncbi:signal recognition particle-docking protein FtsY [Clostridium cylindrosporum]|uniref:Signal recognition particle receptor FtsY n=1 Tax=Clostridium cylindrosporum DSM 605 TaxID=1121307 RepID=A0A0J8D6K3_CLOCY|nr:signal recognition particle-docking protein FtsY [Clostridium cylindrosporum]KMT21482.1 signal recognition particle receptor FtsY [Clostridium cylindrosporum DSM 605]